MTRARDLADSADKDIAGTITLDAVNASGVITGLTVEATGDTAAGDNAAMGYTAAEGLILTGQGSSGDITIKNDADAVVLQVPTGTTNVNVIGSLDVATNAVIDGTALVTGVLTANGGAVFNEDTTDVDFRVESNGNTHMLFVDGGSDHVNIGIDSDRGGVLNVYGTGTPIAVIESEANGTVLKLRSTNSDANAGPGLDLVREATGANSDVLGRMRFLGGDAAGNNDHAYALIVANIEDATSGGEDGKLIFETLIANSSKFRLNFTSTEAVVNEGSENLDFRVETNNNVNTFFVDGGVDKVYIGKAVSDNSDGVQGKLQIADVDSSASVMIHRFSANASSPQLILGKSRNGTIGSSTVLQDGDICGILGFHGNDGSGFHEAAQIAGRIDGSASNNDVPGELIFSTNAGNTGVTQRMRLSAAGELFIGKLGEVSTQDGFQFKQTGECIAGRGSNDTIFVFQDINTSGNTVGSISITSNATAYNTSSDYRLKENVDYTWDATTRLKQLKPARFNFISDDTNTLVDGFLAHEAQAVVPQAVFGTKDAVQVWKNGDNLPDGVSVGDNKLDDDGNTRPQYQAIDHSKLVPLLVKTIHELEARITALEA